MKFSVVIPLYNKQRSLCRSVYSVFNQTNISKSDVELIIVDDGSTDRSLAIANLIKKEHRSRAIIVHSQTNAGVSAARNKGVELATYDFVCFLDADDSYDPNFLSEIQKLIKSYPAARMFASSYRFVDLERGIVKNATISNLTAKPHQLLKDYFYSSATGDLPVISSSVCLNKSALEAIGGFPVGENMGEDQAVWSQVALQHPVAVSRNVCANYSIDVNDSLMSTIVPQCELPYSKRLQRQLDQGDIPKHLCKSVQAYIAGHLLDLVRRNEKAGNLNIAVKLVTDKRAMKLHKRWLFWRSYLFTKSLLLSH